MSTVPDAWEDEWSVAADKSQGPIEEQTLKKPVKVTKAQKRAQQAEFNKQFWAEAEGPTQPNYFLESRNVVPLRQEFKPAPILLSRKGPIQQRKVENQSIQSGQPRPGGQESSDEDDEETEESRRKAYEQRQAQAAREREEKQRKYEERRLELFGPPAANNGDVPAVAGLKTTRSGNTSPGSNTPPHSRSSTPSSRGRKGRNGRGGATFNQPQNQPKLSYQQPQYQLHQHQAQLRELYDPQYSAKPDVLQRQQSGLPQNQDIQPIREPKGPDGSGRGGFGFARGTKVANEVDAGQP